MQLNMSESVLLLEKLEKCIKHTTENFHDTVNYWETEMNKIFPSLYRMVVLRLVK